jgi:hypothetical protein
MAVRETREGMHTTNTVMHSASMSTAPVLKDGIIMLVVIIVAGLRAAFVDRRSVLVTGYCINIVPFLC